MIDSSAIISAFSEDHVERLTGLSKNQLRRWDATGFFKPSLAAENRRCPYSRIYNFIDIAALRVISALRNKHNVTLQHLRKVSAQLGKLDSAGWARTTLYVFNRKVMFDDPESGKKREIISGQYALSIIPLQSVLSDIERDILSLKQRSKEKIGRLEKHRYISHNAEVIAGTRIPVSTILRFVEDGFSSEEIIQEYPTLTEADIEAAEKIKEGTQAA